MFPFATEDDGYTDEAFIMDATKDHHLRIYFRPTGGDDRASLRDRMDGISEQESHMMVCEELGKRIVKWEWLTKEGAIIHEFELPSGVKAKMEPTAENIKKLRSGNLYSKLALIVVYGTEPGHDDPFKNRKAGSPPKDKVEANKGN